MDRSWTLDEVLADYTQLMNDRAANDEDKCGGMHKDSTLANLPKIMRLELGGIQTGSEGLGTGLLDRPGRNDHKGIRPAGVWRNIGLPCFGEALRVIEVMSHEFGMSHGI